MRARKLVHAFVLCLFLCRTLLADGRYTGDCGTLLTYLREHREIYVMVHPKHGTDTFVDEPQFQGMPRIIMPASNVLNQARYRRGEPPTAPDIEQLMSRATLIVLRDMLGKMNPSELPGQVSATTIHMGGGHLQACLANAVAHMPTLLDGNARRKIVIHLDGAWGETGATDSFQRLNSVRDSQIQYILDTHVAQVRQGTTYSVEVNRTTPATLYQGPGTVRASYTMTPPTGGGPAIDVVLVSGSGGAQ